MLTQTAQFISGTIGLSINQAWISDECAVSRPFPLNDPTSVSTTLVQFVVSGWMDTQKTPRSAPKSQPLWFHTGLQCSPTFNGAESLLERRLGLLTVWRGRYGSPMQHRARSLS